MVKTSEARFFSSCYHSGCYDFYDVDEACTYPPSGHFITIKTC